MSVYPFKECGTGFGALSVARQEYYTINPYTMKLSTLSFLLFFAGSMIFGGNLSAQNQRGIYRQSDGTTISYSRMRNLNACFFMSTDGMALLRNERGDLCYTILGDSALTVTGSIAHNPGQRSEEESAEVREKFAHASQAMDWLNRKPFPHSFIVAKGAPVGSEGLGTYGQSLGGALPSIGSPVIPVILVEFSDVHFLPSSTVEEIDQWLNKDGYRNDAGAKGSVREYFHDQSRGLFSPVFKIVAKVQMSHPYAYYGANTGGRLDANKREMVNEAIDSAMAHGVDFNEYVGESGAVDQLSIIHAGQGEQNSAVQQKGSEDFLWASYTNFRFTIGSVTFKGYLVSNEQVANYYDDDHKTHWDGEYILPQSYALDGMGVFCHEMGHVLGLPDMYYTGSSATIKDTLHTMGYWSVMDMGNYLFNGYRPIGYNAYELNSLGWLDMKELKDAQYVSLNPVDADNDSLPRAFFIRNETSPTEFLILENRQPGKWYPAQMGHGMLVTHLDYEASKWRNNTVNNTLARQGFSFIPADGDRGTVPAQSPKELAGDLFPGTANVTELTDESSLVSLLNTGEKLNKPLYGIKEQDGIVSFAFLDRNLTDIGQVMAGNVENSPAALYTSDGRYVGKVTESRLPENLRPGVYILRYGKEAKKILVR